MSSSEWKIGDTVLKEYIVEGVLGHGGMGIVYLLRSLHTGELFAVKRILFQDQRLQRTFLAELQTWIGLPPHPHLVECRFFRTVGAEIAIFAEYVEGGSLKEWIEDGRLYQGGQEKALERILDIAIQFAWGLQVLHGLRHVHQDVRPGNMLMTQMGWRRSLILV